MLHTYRFLMITGLIVAMLVLAGCTREVVTEVVVTATPDPAAVSAAGRADTHRNGGARDSDSSAGDAPGH